MFKLFKINILPLFFIPLFCFNLFAGSGIPYIDIGTSTPTANRVVKFDATGKLSATILSGSITSSQLSSNLSFVGTASGNFYGTHTGNGSGLINVSATVAFPAVTGSATASQLPPSTFLSATSTAYTAAVLVVTGTTWTTISGLSLTVTPRTNNSKILLMASLTLGASGEGKGVLMRYLRNATAIGLGDSDGSRSPMTCFTNGGFTVSAGNTINPIYLDSPGTTAATTYAVQVRGVTDGVVVYVNRSPDDTDIAASGRGISTLTALELY